MRLTAAVLLVCIIIMGTAGIRPVEAQTSWEGTAAAARYGEFPPDGYYAASSAFPRNTIVEVTNEATGRSISVIVVRRSTDPGILMLVSQEAAAALGISPGSPTSVEARRISEPDLTAVDPNEDLPYHPDPDINPAASAGDPNEEVLSPVEDQQETEIAQAEPPAAEIDPGPALDEPPATAERPVEQPPEEEAAPDEPPVEEEPAEQPDVEEEPLEEPSAEEPPRVTDDSDRPEIAEAQEAPGQRPIPEDAREPSPPPVGEEPSEAPERISEAPQRQVVPVPRQIPPTAEPDVEPQVPAEEPQEPSVGPEGRSLIPVPSRRPPVAETEPPAVAEAPPTDEEPVVGPEREMIPVPSRRPPVVEDREPEVVETPLRRGLASGVRGAAGSLALREVEKPEAVLPRPTVEDTGADVRVARVPAPQTPVEEEAPSAPVAEPEPPRPTEPGVAPDAENPLDRAIAAVVGRMPRGDLFPPPRADGVETLLPRPTSPEEQEVVGRLAQARAPAEEVEVEEPTRVVEEPAMPVDPTASEIEPPRPPRRRDVPEPAEAQARIETPEVAERRPAPAEDDLPALAEARPEEEERPRAAGREAAPEDLVTGPLPLARIQEPDASVAAPEAPKDEKLEVAVAEPGVGAEARLVEDDIDAGDLVPEDAVLALEPADFRPPPIPEADAALARPRPEEGEVDAAVARPSAERLVTEARPDGIVERAEPPEEAPPADGREPGMPAGPEHLARPGIEDGEVVAEGREPSPPAEEAGPEAGTRIATSDRDVEAGERAPDVPPGPEAGVRAEAAGERPPSVSQPATPRQPSAEEERATEERMATVVEDEAPAEEEAVVTADETGNWAQKNLPLVGKLSSGAYYLQVGAYSSPRSAKSAIDGFAQDYPLAVLPTDTEDRTVYRLFVGPLNEDERGTMLYWFRARGYKDAFIRKGD